MNYYCAIPKLWFYTKTTKNTRIDFEAKDNAGRTQIVLLVNEKPVE